MFLLRNYGKTCYNKGIIKLLINERIATMKKILSLVMAFTIVLSICGCSNGGGMRSSASQKVAKLEENDHEPIEATLSFRSFKWFENYPVVEQYIRSRKKGEDDKVLGVKLNSNSVSGSNDNLRVPYILAGYATRDEIRDSIDSAKNPNRYISYLNVTIPQEIDIAGHNAKIKMVFLYPIVEEEVM